MTDISVEKNSFLPPDRPWLLWEGTGQYGGAPTTHGKVDFSAFTKNTHYPDGFLPSGLLLGRNGSGNLVPYSGTGAAAGLLYNATAVPADTGRRVAVALVDSFAIVSESRLPANHGVNAAGKTALPLIQFRA